jgi:lactose/L-arabinose transport system ATP-binding protein
VTIVGPTDAGKTTLLRLLGGDEVPMTGTVCFMSNDTEAPVKLETVSTLFLGAASLTATDALSSSDPDVVLVDEWSDSVACSSLERRQYLKNLKTHSRGLIVYATRDGSEALAISDYLVVIRDGCLQQVGTPEEILNEPATEFVATYFGQPIINLLPAILEKDGQAILVGNQTMSLAGRIAEEFCRDITVGVRPEHVRVARERGGWRGRVVSVEDSNEHTIVTVNVEGVSVRAQSTESFSQDETVFVRLLPRYCIVFDDCGHLLEQL